MQAQGEATCGETCRAIQRATSGSDALRLWSGWRKTRLRSAMRRGFEKLFTLSGKQIPASLSQRADQAFAKWIDQRRQPLTAMWSSATAQGLALERRQPSGGHEIALSALGRGASTRKYRPCAGTPQRAEAGGRAGKTVLSLKPPH